MVLHIFFLAQKMVTSCDDLLWLLVLDKVWMVSLQSDARAAASSSSL